MCIRDSDHADLAGVDAEIDAIEDAPLAVPGFELLDFDQGLSLIHISEPTRPY